MFIYFEWASDFLFEILMRDLFVLFPAEYWMRIRPKRWSFLRRPPTPESSFWMGGWGAPVRAPGAVTRPVPPAGCSKGTMGAAKGVCTPGMVTHTIVFCLLFVNKIIIYGPGVYKRPLTPGSIMFFSSLQQLPCLGPGPLNGLLSWLGSFPKALNLSPDVLLLEL